MSPRAPHRGRTIPLLIACFYAGGATGWCLHARFSPNPSAGVLSERATPGAGAAPRTTDKGTKKEVKPDAAELRSRHLRLPVDGADVELLKNAFAEGRDASGRLHEAVDILAPRNTPVRAVENGTIAKLFTSKAGGTTIYQFDSTQRFCYYYAHLEGYAHGLHEAQTVSAGDLIGYVGTSGNAPANTPHLHFAIFELTPERQWWNGRAIDPYLMFKR